MMYCTRKKRRKIFLTFSLRYFDLVCYVVLHFFPFKSESRWTNQSLTKEISWYDDVEIPLRKTWNCKCSIWWNKSQLFSFFHFTLRIVLDSQRVQTSWIWFFFFHLYFYLYWSFKSQVDWILSIPHKYMWMKL